MLVVGKTYTTIAGNMVIIISKSSDCFTGSNGLKYDSNGYTVTGNEFQLTVY